MLQNSYRSTRSRGFGLQWEGYSAPANPSWRGGAVSPLSKNPGAPAQPFRLRASVLWASPRPRNFDFVPTPLRNAALASKYRRRALNSNVMLSTKAWVSCAVTKAIKADQYAVYNEAENSRVAWADWPTSPGFRKQETVVYRIIYLTLCCPNRTRMEEYRGSFHSSQ